MKYGVIGHDDVLFIIYFLECMKNIIIIVSFKYFMVTNIRLHFI